MLGGRFEESLRPIPQAFLPTLDKVEKKSRPHPAELAPASRLGNFDEVETGLTEEQALAEAERCLNCALCSECNRCVETCKQHAIDHAMRERTVTLDVGSVILTPGFAEFDASRKGEFGYGRYSNVVTSVQFERMLVRRRPVRGTCHSPVGRPRGPAHRLDPMRRFARFDLRQRVLLLHLLHDGHQTGHGRRRPRRWAGRDHLLHGHPRPRQRFRPVLRARPGEGEHPLHQEHPLADRPVARQQGSAGCVTSTKTASWRTRSST